MPPPYIISSSQRRSPFHLADELVQMATASKSHAARSSSRLRLPSEGWGQRNGPEKPLEGWKIWVTVVACIIGTVLLSWILHYCWKHCGPRPTYYEVAMRSDKKGPAGQFTKSRRYPRCASRRIASTRWVDPVVVAVDERLARPDTAQTRSSSCYSEQ
ncbi:hypothetical protein F5Y09DRAFT_230890 [Xylaria sp. FL1042]|nr:hypothetical protein F5Y09DRAFT_230890 [Xylaria sp. FL1042]